MNEGDQPGNLSQQLEDILVQTGMFSASDDPQKIRNSAYYKLLQLVVQNKILSIDDLVDKFDLRGYLLSCIQELKEKSIIKFENDLLSIHESSGIIVPELEPESMPELGIGVPSGKLKTTTSASSTANAGDDDLDSLFDDVLGESIEDFVSDFETLYVKSEDGTKSEIPVLIDLLKDKGYFKDISDNTEVIKEVPYQIVRSILEQHPISTEEIEAKIEDDVSISMYLSNLRSDDVIDQTNDYRWTLSKKTFKILKEFVEKIGLSQAEGDEDAEDMKLFDEFVDDEDQQFIMACIELGYVYHPGMELNSYLQKPEIEVLNVVRTMGPIADTAIKDTVEHTLPVVVKRMISRLQADEVIKIDQDGRWKVAPRLKFLMTKDLLKEALDEDRFEELEQKYLSV